MKPSSISFWSILLTTMGFSVSSSVPRRQRRRGGAIALPTTSSGSKATAGYYGRGPYVVYQAPRHWNGPVLYGRRGQPVYVTAGRLGRERLLRGHAAQRDLSGRARALSQAACDAAWRPEGRGFRAGARMVPPSFPAWRPGGRPGRRSSRSDLGRLCLRRGRRSRALAVPVPRPNLEGMDFAPATPGAAITAPARQADEGRR